ncbi:ABC transporter permease [Oharaeibacter diazotrophicus]|uniref:NitT/TauT family transport system permease protein n=1 Tax=Oharaeibacter diazotrophicus TaxID=1920512 RepID=A0A4R6RL28_9HYPH|nr:ABC transporter permease [Oharaeibacter diazotrophicus]TDP87204.1 NitT/TauT family transport system permease protein [Oharaeibacter diazotrophicus]BBE70853.1 putative aliphatic sulfonates transport permease protein SsuC [Pleomorphomonas sp. SM30]GLS77602.1 ABC transporter permease [Oharaeibacter diazotrophicus]
MARNGRWPIAGAVFGAGLLAVWETVARTGLVAPLFLPPPSTVVAAAWTMTTTGGLLGHAAISTVRVWAAFLIAAAMAVPIGIAMGSYPPVRRALEPTLDFVRYLPVPALVPLAIIWFGIGETTKIFLLWMGTFFQLVLMVADDVRRVPHEYGELAATLGAPKPRALLDVTLPAMLPTLWDNMRITLGWCWSYVIVAEIVAADSGLGFVIMTSRRYFKTPEVMAGVIAIGVIGLVTDQILRALHGRLFPYLAR